MAEKFAAAGMSLFGYGALAELAPFLQREEIKKALIVTDASINKLGLLKPVQEALENGGSGYIVFDGVMPNPTLQNVNDGVKLVADNHCDAIVAVGGGSANDCAKAIRILEANGGELRDYMGGNRPKKKGKYLIAVNTTAGTGSEVSRAFLISDEKEKRKLIFKDDYAMPDIAVNDVQLMMDLPASITAQTGMDALTHAIEGYISKGRFALTDLLARDAMKLIYDNLETAVQEPHNKKARENMSLGQYLAGLSFGSSGLGLVHAMAHQLGAGYHLAHGLCNAILLPVVMEYDLAYCPRELAEIARLLNPDECVKKSDEECAAYAVKIINELSDKLGTKIWLEDLGVKEDDLPYLAERSLEDGCILTAPQIPEKEEIIKLFKKVMRS